MMIKVIWTPQAIKGLEIVIAYLEDKWTVKEILNLELKLKNLIEQISKYPEICPTTTKFKNLHKGLIDKNNYIIYRINTHRITIEIINFRETKQKPII